MYRFTFDKTKGTANPYLRRCVFSNAKIVFAISLCWLVLAIAQASHAQSANSGTVSPSQVGVTNSGTQSNTAGDLFNIPNSPTRGPNRAIIEPAPSPALMFGRTGIAIKSALKPLSEKFAAAVVDMENEDGRKSLGTIVSKDKGLIIGKYSELKGSIYCLLNGEKAKCRLVAFHRGHDLALIAIPPSYLENNQQVTLPYQAGQTPSGKMVVSINGKDRDPTLGIISVLPTRFDVKQPKQENGIDLGVTVSRQTKTKQVQTSRGLELLTGVEVARVYPRSVAEQIGLLKGDLVKSANNQSIFSQNDLSNFSRQVRVGQSVEFTVVRNGKIEKLVTKIESFAPKTIHDRWGGGPFSEKRFGFGQVVCHDSVIEPQQCGGPLVDLNGNLVGINISRSMRVATFAIPIRDVQKFIDDALPKIRVPISE